MAAATSLLAPAHLTTLQAASPAHTAHSGSRVSTPPLGPVSPTSAESLIDHTLEELGLSPMEAGPPQAQPRDLGLAQLEAVADLFPRFADLLDCGLHNTANKITSDIKADLQVLGSRIEVMETKLDATISRTNQNTDCIQMIKEQLEMAMAKIDDFENRHM